MIENIRYKFDQNIIKEKQISIISGSDEAGRGAMAGPVVVASVILKPNYNNPLVKDSKQLSEIQREALYQEIIDNAIEWKVSIIEAQRVDILNPKQSSVVGMIETIRSFKTKPDLALIDGEDIKVTDFAYLKLIKGDDLSQSIAAASIIAKVTRDRIMNQYEIDYPGYGFANHKGYCALKHKQATAKLGVLDIHRKSYKPIKDILNSINSKK
ncbi:ribonuclease HII [Mesoplasma photuris]|uniref:ribonuclease HII n=1 Tax=Mesoplasma photuris TaxID=217731 RepID=UPI0004E0B27C|nr:ribonuclease HII [Mesoplasma photuris]